MAFDPSMMANMFYAAWYKEDVSPNLSAAQKKELLQKLSEYSLYHPMEGKISKQEFPELAPYSNTDTFTGTQLYTVMHELFNEVSGHKLDTPYPHFPEGKKSKKMHS